MKKLEKAPYVAPTIKVVTFKAEKGFANSMALQQGGTTDPSLGEPKSYTGEKMNEVTDWGTF